MQANPGHSHTENTKWKANYPVYYQIALLCLIAMSPYRKVNVSFGEQPEDGADDDDNDVGER